MRKKFISKGESERHRKMKKSKHRKEEIILCHCINWPSKKFLISGKMKASDTALTHPNLNNGFYYNNIKKILIDPIRRNA